MIDNTNGFNSQDLALTSVDNTMSYNFSRV